MANSSSVPDIILGAVLDAEVDVPTTTGFLPRYLFIAVRQRRI